MIFQVTVIKVFKDPTRHFIAGNASKNDSCNKKFQKLRLNLFRSFSNFGWNLDFWNYNLRKFCTFDAGYENTWVLYLSARATLFRSPFSKYLCSLNLSTHKCLMPVLTTIANFGTVREVCSRYWEGFLDKFWRKTNWELKENCLLIPSCAYFPG